MQAVFSVVVALLPPATEWSCLQKQRLEAIQTEVASDAKLAFLPGAGAVYMSGCKYAVVEDRWMAIFVGCASLAHTPHLSPVRIAGFGLAVRLVHAGRLKDCTSIQGN